MKAIAIDFKNRIICVMTDTNATAKISEEVENKEDFSMFIPSKFSDKTSFTWNFEDETVSVNQDYTLRSDTKPGKECFIPELIMPMPGLKRRYGKMLSLIDVKVINPQDDKEENQSFLTRLLGL